MGKFTDKVALITGASSGIGAVTALHFAKLGANVAITGRNVEALNNVAEEIKTSTKSKVLAIPGDLAKEEDVKNIVDKTIKEFGQLDVLINNAGFTIRGNIEDVKLEDLDAVFNVNVRAVYQLTSLAVPYLIKSKGAIVNISSVAGLRASPGNSIYCMSKSALDQFTKCIALELAPKGVRVNSLNPGYIVTDFQRRAGFYKTKEEEKAVQEWGAKLHPMQRIGQSEECAKAIEFLASDDSSFTTGALFPIDGGLHLACPR